MQLKNGGKPLRWGELVEDEEAGNETLEFLLPPKQVIGPDNNGVKKVIEYKFNDDGNKVKITTTIRVRKHVIKNKKAIERRTLPKFGDAVDEDVGARLTIVSTEKITIERPTSPGTEKEDAQSAVDDSGLIMVCRTCGKKGDHWTAKCPYKDLAQPSESFIDKPPTDGPASSATTRTEGAYVPPSLRATTKKSVTDTRGRNKENSVRVTNLSEDTREADLHELFRPFGHITRAYVPIDRKTGLSKGFGFVAFANLEDAERAINKLNGYGYDNLILKVEWAPPKANLN